MFLRPKTLFASLLLILAAPVAAQAQTIEESIQVALKAYPTISGAELRRTAQEAGIGQARAARMPTVGWETSATVRGDNDREMADIHGVMARMPLYTGGAIKAGIREQEALHEQATHTLATVRDDVALNAATAYVGWYQASISVKLAEKNIEGVGKIVDDVKTVADADPGRRADYDQAVVRLAKARQEADRQRAILGQAEATYQRYFGVKPPAQAGLDEAMGLEDARLERAMPQTLAEALGRARQHPRIAEAQAASSAAFQSVAKAKSELKPQVGLAVGSGDGGNVQLTFTWKGFDMAARRGVSVASANAQAGEYEVADARLRVEEDVRKAWAEMEGASQRQEPAITQVTTGARVLEAYRDQFQIGRRTLLDLLNASDEVYSNQLSALQADMELRVARYRVVSAMGGLADRY